MSVLHYSLQLNAHGNYYKYSVIVQYDKYCMLTLANRLLNDGTETQTNSVHARLGPNNLTC